MIVSRLTKLKESTYEVEIENEVYVLDEETVLKYRLFKGYEISSDLLKECIQSNELETIKKKAYSYYLRYQKNAYEIIKYLTDREILYSQALEAVNELEEKGLLNELGLAVLVAGSLARNSNGEKMIRYKLKNRHFKNDVIEASLMQLTEEDIEEGKAKLYAKAMKRFGKLPSYEQKQKLKEVFYRHGYIEGFSS
ncbi:MAG: RecX family transcriptional regulator [Anaeroplasmataceae bacterium]|nr:RecX family transcriptional regulator [Anaeroplasmataceae bacterium]MDE6415347.1 RecX family transcriptional regulator [Anaeroplasmataceae bacterium]